MARRQLWSREALEQETASDRQLSAEQIAAYLRQSTTRQVENNLESADLQLTGAQKYALSQGLDADKIMIAHEGNGERGVSGTLRIDQREKLQEIMADIYTDKIKVVWAYSVSRLFRDQYGVQVGTFVQACAEHHVKVVIETAKTFDFSDQMDVLMFQMLANVAAKENDDRARLMRETKANKALRGQYHGRQLTPGFIVDRNKDSKTYGRYIPYEPHADVARRLYKRFRELSGRFNLLAHEVAQMPFVFPEFESWVDQRDIHQFRLKRVPGGYHLTKSSLVQLLTAVEYAGYWKFKGELLTDANGQPKINHEPIIPLDDWQFAFDRLSFKTLTGEDNTARYDARATWEVAKTARQEPLLCGLLTSPLGTVQYSNGTFTVTERRPWHFERSATLMVKSDIVDRMFIDRLQDRYLEADMVPYDRIIEELVTVREKNAKALVSVDQQIAKYEKSIASKQVVLAALGADLDVETAKKYNQDIKDDRANLNALLVKKNAANAEESQLLELHEKIDQFLAGEFKDREQTRRFIRLACDKIELNEYSAHFATLKVTWSAPFAQVDVGYIYLPNGVHEPWTEQDLEDLATLYPRADRAEVLQRFPTRSWSGISSYANRLGHKRHTGLNTSNLPINVSLLDQQVMDRLGINPNAGFLFEDAWDTNVSDASSICSSPFCLSARF